MVNLKIQLDFQITLHYVFSPLLALSEFCILSYHSPFHSLSSDVSNSVFCILSLLFALEAAFRILDFGLCLFPVELSQGPLRILNSEFSLVF